MSIAEYVKDEYLKRHIIEGDYAISFTVSKYQKKYKIYQVIDDMRIFCNDINVLKNRDKDFLYEECYNTSKKYNNYKYVIDVKYNRTLDYLFDEIRNNRGASVRKRLEERRKKWNKDY